MTNSTRQFGLSKSRWGSVMGALVALMIVLGNPGTAAAQQITGDIGFGGAFTPADSSFVAASLDTATSIDYNGDAVQNSATGGVVLATGDFSAAGIIPFVTTATLYDFTFNPLVSGGVDPLWEVSAFGFSFALSSVSILVQTSQTLSLVGTGIVRHSDYVDTAGTWNFTGNPAGSSFVFSAGSGVTPIPEPEIYAMLAAGLGLMGFIARRRKQHDDAVI